MKFNRDNYPDPDRDVFDGHVISVQRLLGFLVNFAVPTVLALADEVGEVIFSGHGLVMAPVGLISLCLGKEANNVD